MNFSFTYDSSVASAPAGFMTALNAAASYLSHVFTDNITINIQVGYGEENGNVMSGALGQSQGAVYSWNESYSQLRSQLIADGTSPDDAAAAGTLGASDPAGSGAYVVTTAQAKALGLMWGNAAGIDGWVGLSSQYAMSYDPNHRSVSGEFDAVGIFIHEITEVMGRVGSMGSAFGTNEYTALDLYHYSGAGARDMNLEASNFSVDGQHMLNQFGDPSQTDVADWGASVYGDSFGYGFMGSIGAVSPTDLREMDVIGYNRAAAVYHDFNGDGVSDLLWYNASANTVAAFNESNVSAPTWVGIGSAAANWTVAGTGDFNGDRTADILWYNSSTHAIGAFSMSYNNTATWVGLGSVGAGWTVAGTGDFNGDKTSDILLYNASSNSVGEFQMANNVATWVGIGSAGAGWAVAGTGDFNGDGTTDILWYNSSANAVGEFQMNNGSPTWQALGTVGAGWTVAATGDFNGDGTTDILWYNSSTNAVGEFQMSGGRANWVGIGTAGSGWTVAGAADVNGDGVSDIIWSNASSHAAGAFLMNSSNTPTWQGLGSASSGWSLIG